MSTEAQHSEALRIEAQRKSMILTNTEHAVIRLLKLAHLLAAEGHETIAAIVVDACSDVSLLLAHDNGFRDRSGIDTYCEALIKEANESLIESATALEAMLGSAEETLQ